MTDALHLSRAALLRAYISLETGWSDEEVEETVLDPEHWMTLEAERTISRLVEEAERLTSQRMTGGRP